MIKKVYNFLLLLALVQLASCEVETTETADISGLNRPKLVVGIVVDQMRYDYIYRYWDHLSKDGLKRLVKKGFYCRNTQFNYVPTSTGPGHASIYTGTTPGMHGIVANVWFDRNSPQAKYCVGDDSAEPVGTSSPAGKMSPANLLCSTLGDEMHLATNFKTKVVGISLKDRGAILPAGHTANGAYWFNSLDGKFISSNHYVEALPDWVNTFNSRNLSDEYLSSDWTLLRDESAYIASNPDDTPYEIPLSREEKAVFPHKLSDGTGSGLEYTLLKNTPFGNDLLTDLAKAAIAGEQLGRGENGDMLFISYSATDGVGHQFGPHSMEMQDTYLRFDQNIADLLNHLDTEIGKDQYLVFLTADHGAVSVPNYLMDKKIPGGYYRSLQLEDTLRQFMRNAFGKNDYLLNVSNDQVYLNRELISQNKLDRYKMQREIADFLVDIPGVKQAFTGIGLQEGEYVSKLAKEIRAGYSQKASGDLMFAMEPGWIEFGSKGTTHGSGYNYDTHVPLIFYGWEVKAGESFRKHAITDIAPTIAAMLSIQEPNCATGTVIREMIE